MSKDIMPQVTQVVREFMGAQPQPLDLHDITASLTPRFEGSLNGSTKKMITLAVYRLVDNNELTFTTDRRVTVPRYK